MWTLSSNWHGLAVLLAVLLACTLRNKRKPPVVIWVVTPDSTGLQHDAIILEHFLESSQTALLSQAPPPANDHPCVYLYLEVSPMNLPPYAHPGWKTHHHHQQKCRVALMVNTDQFTNNVLETPNLELILCKTRQCVTWVDQAQQERLEATNSPPVPIGYIGFTSENPSSTTGISHDDVESSLARFDKFLHVAGKSPNKGTMSIVHAWMQHSEWPTLTLTSFHNPTVHAILVNLQQQHGLPPNIEHFNNKLNKTTLAKMMQRHGVHLCLSGMEGFGHYINEGRAVGALVMTTDFPAMNEVILNDSIGILVPPTRLVTWRNGLPYAHVDADAIVQTMEHKILSKSLQDRADIGSRARRAYFQDQVVFAKRASQVYCYFNKCKGIIVNSAESRACAENTCELQLE